MIKNLTLLCVKKRMRREIYIKVCKLSKDGKSAFVIIAPLANPLNLARPQSIVIIKPVDE